MHHPWRLNHDDPRLDSALKITMDYLQAKGLTLDRYTVQRAAAVLIYNEWRKGVRHQIRLANTAIVQLELPATIPIEARAG